MAIEKATISLREYLHRGKEKTFVIPEYQRGYVWGKRRPNEVDSVTNLVRNLKECFGGSPNRDVFLQGVTVTESEKAISVIDGQQRTTFFYLLLKILGCQEVFHLCYLSGREESQRYIDGVSTGTNDPLDEKEPFQDVYYFKKTIGIIRSELAGVPEDKFVEFVLDYVKFLYVDIPADQAVRVFTMMNGNKATMLPEEVIKAEVLRVASKSKASGPEDFDGAEWQANLLRSRYAREWDKWLHWWNREDVRKTFACDNVMGRLISSVVDIGDDKLTFELFNKRMFTEKSAREAKRLFDRLRRQQKLFEDLFNDYRTHNQIGSVVSILRKRDVEKFVRDLTARPQDIRLKLDEYCRCVFLGMGHCDIVRLLGIVPAEKSEDVECAKKAFQESYERNLKALRDPLLYMSGEDSKECAFRYLLRRNVEQDTKQMRKFDFGIWKMRSLEHIYAKSKVWHWDDEAECQGNMLDGNGNLVAKGMDEIPGSGYLPRSNVKISVSNGIFRSTEHGIGNLVLLYVDENRDFNSSSFEEKKEQFFNPNKTNLMKSRRLLHTVCVFAEQKDWDGKSIARNALGVLAEFEEYYKNMCERYHV